MKFKNDKGITLIALVITIIVLLILSGVTINMVLGDDGIIAQAQQAKEEQEDADKKDDVAIKTGEASISKYATGLTNEEVKIKSNNQITNATNASLREIKLIKKGGTGTDKNTTIAVPIPKGMAYVEGNTVEEGVVVTDSYGNEFVWVPVNTSDSTLAINNANVSEVGSDTTMKAEETAMKTSVGIYKGFYVGRYETSWTGSRVASVPNVEPMNGNTPIEEVESFQGMVNSDGMGANWYTFYNNQKALHANSNSVVSGMIYGSQWDAIMDWMSGVINQSAVDPETTNKYIYDSTDMGNYSSTIIKTGSNLAYSVNNIFDLAGNYSEWTQCHTAVEDMYITRGGGVYSVHQHANDSIDYLQNDPVGEVSSRIQLYIK